MYIHQWPFQDPKLEVPTIYKAYVREYPHKIWPYMVQYLHFRILKFPFNTITIEFFIFLFMASVVVPFKDASAGALEQKTPDSWILGDLPRW